MTGSACPGHHDFIIYREPDSVCLMSLKLLFSCKQSERDRAREREKKEEKRRVHQSEERRDIFSLAVFIAELSSGEAAGED